jgi:hypothetical protein
MVFGREQMMAGHEAAIAYLRPFITDVSTQYCYFEGETQKRTGPWENALQDLVDQLSTAGGFRFGMNRDALAWDFPLCLVKQFEDISSRGRVAVFDQVGYVRLLHRNVSAGSVEIVLSPAFERHSEDLQVALGNYNEKWSKQSAVTVDFAERLST